MLDLRYGQLFKALFIAGVVGYLSVAFFGAIWVGIPIFMASGWLFYEFRKKLSILKQVFMEELPKGIKSGIPMVKKGFWDNNDCKFCCVLYFFFLYLLLISTTGWIGVIVSFIVPLFLFALLSDIDVELDDESQVEAIKKIPRLLFLTLPKFFLWTCPKFLFWICPRFVLWICPKFLLRVIILTIHKVHSKELVASSIYALLGMFYVIIFPPFELVPQMVFLMAIGCGLFTGGFGCLVHKVLSTTVAQTIFTKVEAW